MNPPGVTTTESGNVRLIGAGNLMDLTPDEATELAEELSDAVRVLARSRLEDLRDRARARAEAVSE